MDKPSWIIEESVPAARKKALEGLEKARQMHQGEIPVKINSKTTIFVKPGTDPETARRKFLERAKI